MKYDKVQEKTPLEQEVLADISPEGQHEKRISRYSSAKGRQENVLEYILTTLDSAGKGNLEKEAEALRACGSYLIFRHYYSIDAYKMIAGCTCKKHLLCALCAIRRAAKYIAVYSQKIKAVSSLGVDREFDTVMITFTVKNGSDLEERFNHLLCSMKRLLQKRRNSLRLNPEVDTVLKHVTSAVYSYEITWNSDTEEWHPHCHMIALIPKGSFEFDEFHSKNKKGNWYNWQRPTKLWKGLCADWQAITLDSKIIDVRKIDNPGSEIPEPETPYQDLADSSLLKALVETFKYALKMNDLDVEQQVHVYETLKGRRLIGSFGSLRGIRISKNLNDAPLDDSELPFIDLLYQYSGVTFGYQVIMRGELDIESAPHGMLDLENRIKRNQSANRPGHYSARVDTTNLIEQDVKKWFLDPDLPEKIKSIPITGSF